MKCCPLTWQTGTHSYKAYSSYGILEAYRTAQVWAHVANDGCEHAYEDDGGPEA